MQVQIANPIYDVVFKYLMEDNDIAKLVVSTIIGEEVVYLDPKPQEYTAEKTNIEGKNTSITVYRLDFAAKIKTAAGYKMVLIEMQKAKLPTDISRFRSYLGEQYVKEDESVTDQEDDIENIQLYCLYFLGTHIGISNIPVVVVNPQARDVATGDLITQKNSFIEALHHRSWIIQISYLKVPRRTDMERLLAVFDQSYCTKDPHIMEVIEDDFPEMYRCIIRRLKMAAGDPEVRKQMKLEDRIIKYLRKWVRNENEHLTQALAEKDQALAERDQLIAQINQTLEIERKKNEDFAARLADLERLLKSMG